MSGRQSPGAAGFTELAALRQRCARAEAEASGLTTALAERTAELGAARARFRDIIEHNPDAIVVVDGEGVIRFVNGRAADLFGTSRDELHGTAFGFPMAAGETTELDVLRAGQTIVVEMRVVETEWEQEPACIAALRDITERKRAEQDARRLVSEQAARTTAEAAARRFRFLADAGTLLASSLDYEQTLRTLARLAVDHIADWALIYMLDPLGSVERLEVAHRDPALTESAQALRALPIEASGANPVLEVLRTRQSTLITDIDDAQLAAMTDGTEHFELAHRLGVSSVMLVPLIARDRELGAIGFVSSSRERPFTEDDLAVAEELAARAALAVDNVRLYRAAQEANEAKTNLLAVISHDLRTPLNSIMGHAELLEMGLPEPLGDASLERVERIRLSAAHLVYLIDQLLSFARLESGHDEVLLQPTDAAALTRDVAAVIEPLAHSAGLQFIVQVCAERTAIVTDPDRLRQVLLNLAGNACKYTQEGEVRLSLSDGERNYLEWAVSDTGVGIDATHLDHIFEPFWQADPAQRTRNGGTGLGLSVVRRLISMLGGTVSVRSEPGRGSTFTVRLPLEPVRTSPGEPREA
jgi:signal transduction histidine kinase